MKLRNKKTGDVFDFDSITDLCFGSKIQLQATNMHNKPIYIFNSLAELNAEWEDYEEPKECWFLNSIGGVIRPPDTIDWVQQDITYLKQIGNYFETREEAEQAVEKLKAIRKLSKCGFRFEGYTDRDRANSGDIVIYAHVDIPNNNLLEEAQPAMLKDLDLLFGGKE